MFCRQCGTDLGTGAKFCRSCGAPVATTSSQGTATIGSATNMSAPAAARARVTAPAPSVINGAQPSASNSPSIAQQTVEMPAFTKPEGAISQTVSQAETVSAPTRRGTGMWLVLVIVVLVAGIAGVLFRGQKPQPAASDTDIQQAIINKFAADPNVSQCAVQVTSEHAVVTLSGSVNKASDRTAADKIALQQPGVKTVVDNLVVGQ